jgi:hypothetical protein
MMSSTPAINALTSSTPAINALAAILDAYDQHLTANLQGRALPGAVQQATREVRLILFVRILNPTS